MTILTAGRGCAIFLFYFFTHAILRTLPLRFCAPFLFTLHPGLIVWQSSHQPNLTRQNFSPTMELIPIDLLKEAQGALDFSSTKRNLLLILEISHQPVGEIVRNAILFKLALHLYTIINACYDALMPIKLFDYI